MIKLNEMLNDFETIAKEIQTTSGKININDFVARLVICYEETDKQKKQDEYNIITNYVEKLNKIDIDYKAKENKYFYLLSKNDFENQKDFETLKQLFNKKDNDGNYKILTINLNNIKQYTKFLDLTVKLLENK